MLSQQARRSIATRQSALSRTASYSLVALSNSSAQHATTRSNASRRALPTATASQTRSLATAVASPQVPRTPLATQAGGKPLFNKILIANRGEIACRVMRTAQALGIKCVAVFSEADKDSMHVKLADEAYLLGPAPSAESYLRTDKILEICEISGAQAVHPGYGFLSENAGFAKALEERGLVFIGPPASAIVSMGSKSESKDIMLKAGVPCVPGWHPSSASEANHQDPDFLQSEADKIGYPVLIKAVSGGGGKGMKIVDKESDFKSQLESAKRESMKSFGDDTVLLEKYLSTPRHVEVQVFSDTLGTHVSLFERDCSVQRRHQKIIEEAPAPGLAPELRERLFDMARKAAAAVNYVGAGTVEFIMDAEDPNKFFFMEMNTRLQVEHPVTEAITGVDLVAWQLEVAAGNPIPLAQSEIKCTGHAFECRIYAENPRNNFLPDTGLLLHVQPPTLSPSVRLETGFTTGDAISVFYDPLIAKLIVHGSNRTEALRVLRKALEEYQVVGPHTNIEFLKVLASHPSFVAAEVETGFIPKHFDSLFAPPPAPSPTTYAATALNLAWRDLTAFSSASSTSSTTSSPWTKKDLSGYRVASSAFSKKYAFEDGTVVAVGASSSQGFDGVTVEQPSQTSTRFEGPIAFGGASDVTVLGDRRVRVDVVPRPLGDLEGGERLSVFNTGESFAGELKIKEPEWIKAVREKKTGGAGAGSKGGARAPMPSRIVQLFVSAGQTVKQGDPLVTVEAMKTEHVLRAPRDGVIESVRAKEGELVKEGAVLVQFVEEEPEA